MTIGRCLPAALVGLVLLAACGGGATGDSGSDGSYPFSSWERCYENYDDPDSGPPGEENVPDELPAGCSNDGELNLLHPGAELVSMEGEEALFDVVYRGGFLQRGDTGLPSNPEYVGIGVAFDVTVRADQGVELGSDGFEPLTVTVFRGSADSFASSTIEPCSSAGVTPTGGALVIDPGETLTVVYCFYAAGPPEFLEGDPYIEITALTTSRNAGYRAVLAVDHTLPLAALEDARSSLETVAAIKTVDGFDWGAAAFEDRYGGVTEDLVSEDLRGQGAEEAAAPEAEAAPLPPPPSPSAAPEPAPEEEPEPDTGDTDDGEVIDPDRVGPSLTESASELMADRLPDGFDGYIDCSLAADDVPCVGLVQQDTGNYTDSRFEGSVKVRWTIDGPPDWHDVVLLLESDTGQPGSWTIAEEWQNGPDRPLWAG